MTTLDYSILFACLGLIFFTGLMLARRNPSRDEFHVASRSMGWIPIGFSIAATAFSATNFTGFSGEVYQHGFYVVMAVPVLLLMAVPIYMFILPAYYRLRPISAYEWLEKQFDRRVRHLAGAMFLLWRLAWMALMVYATGAILSAISGIPAVYLILITGIITTAYTLLGGMRAVMTTDILQFLILFTSLATGVVVASRLLGGFDLVLNSASANGLLQPFFPGDSRVFSFDPTIRISFWSVLFGAGVAFLARYGVDQMVVQRYFTARSLADSRRGFLLNIVSYIITLLILASIGLAVHAYMASTGRLTTHTVAPMQALALFVQSLPGGLAGFLIAGLCAATMSSLDSGIHSCCTVMAQDFFINTTKERVSVSRERWIVLLVGVLVTLMALGTGGLKRTVFELANVTVNGLGSPLLALFIFGFLRNRVSCAGVLSGGIAGLVFSMTMSLLIRDMALHYYAVINLLGTLGFGFLFSIFLRDKVIAGSRS